MAPSMFFYFYFVVLVSSSPIYFDQSGHPAEENSGTDTGLYNKGLEQGDLYRRKAKASQESTGSSFWPNGIVYYKLDDRIGCPDSAQCEILMRAMNHYHAHSCIRFQEWTGEKDYVYIFLNSNSAACWSTVGKVGGMQLLSLGRRCWYQGIVIHELGHSIGLSHEMNRPDRDNYIEINWDNIQPGFEAAFEKEISYKLLSEKFDYKSIMMYDEFAFSKDKESPTIVPKDKSVIGPIWRKPGLSGSDIRRIQKLYECSDNHQLTTSLPDVKCSFDTDTCGFKNANTNAWRWNNLNETDGYMYMSRSSSRTDESEEESEEDTKGDAEEFNQTGYFVSVNFLGTGSSQEKTDSSTGCVRFWYILKGNNETYLKLRQTFLSQPTQLTIVPEDTFDLWESEDFSDTWSFLEIPLYVNNPFKLIFESSLGQSTEGLIALDDFQLIFSPCPNKVRSTSSRSKEPK